MFLKPAKYAIVIGKSDNEQGPRLVKSPRRLRPIIIARKLMNIEKKPGNWP